MKKLILASKSPRRNELLRYITDDFDIIPAIGEEIIKDGITPCEVVKSLALSKANEVYNNHKNSLVIGADTVVAAEGRILGKPLDEEDARSMLRLLSGKTHSVFTGVALVSGDGTVCFASETKVTFYSLSEDEIDNYIHTGEPFDKAGAYGIQGVGALLVQKIDGDYYNVMGLPIGELNKKIKNLKKSKKCIDSDKCL